MNENAIVKYELILTRALGSDDQRSCHHDRDRFLTIEERSAIIFYRGIELEIAIVFCLKFRPINFEKVN